MNISHCGKGVGTMTREEAIEIINCYDIGFYDLSGKKIPANKLADAFDMAIKALEELPKRRKEVKRWKRKALKAEPVKHGEWEEKETHLNEGDCEITEWQSARCSKCGKYHTTPYMYSFDNFNFCPNCGAKMKGQEE